MNNITIFISKNRSIIITLSMVILFTLALFAVLVFIKLGATKSNIETPKYSDTISPSLQGVDLKTVENLLTVMFNLCKGPNNGKTSKNDKADEWKSAAVQFFKDITNKTGEVTTPFKTLSTWCKTDDGQYFEFNITYCIDDTECRDKATNFNRRKQSSQ